MPGGTSDSAKRRRLMKEEDPDRYRELLRKQQERYHERKRKREEYWTSGTRQAEEDKEAYYVKRRAINRKSAKKSTEEGRMTRTSSRAAETIPAARVNRSLMTPEERREHDNKKRRERREKKSRQKRTAEKIAHAKYMREWRKGKSAVPQPLTSTPKQIPDVPPSTLQPSEIQPRTSSPACTPVKKKKMRQHCYNTCTKMKSVLKKSFTDEESANMSANLILRKTPQKKAENLNKLWESPDVRAFARKKLSIGPTPKRRKIEQSQHTVRRKQAREERYQLTKFEIQRYFKNPAISRVLPHKRFATKMGPGYVMMVTLRSAHASYQQHCNKKVGFSTFASLRPKNVRKLGTVPVETCLCITCTNVKLKIDALNSLLGAGKAIMAEGRLFHLLLCPYKGKWPRAECVHGNCLRCQDRIRPFTTQVWEIFHDNVKWFHWERRPTMIDNKMKLDIHPYEGSVCDLLEQLGADLNEPSKGTTFVRHLFTAYWQQSQYEAAKEGLRRGQVLMVQDFAENRKAVYHAEVKSAHFGKAQVSLHPAVCFYKDCDGQLVRHVAMFFSDDIGHDYHAVHRYTERTVAILQKETAVKEVILWSDGAASQYKGKGTFADLSLYPFPVQRNFFGSEHGKGEADGETGRFSQAMARAVAGGKYFRDARDMVEFGATLYETTPLKRYSFVLVERDEINRERPETDVATLPGTRQLHQVVKKAPYILAARKLSCFCTGCIENKADCCTNKEYVQPYDLFKLKPSKPLEPANEVEEPVEEPVEEVEPETPVYTSSEIPAVGEWLEIVGSVEKKGKPKQDMTYYANVVAAPDGASQDHFWVTFLKRTPSGSYVTSDRVFQIVPGTPENYRWRIIATPCINGRGHYFFI